MKPSLHVVHNLHFAVKV
uniref:Uncharacterized protein n=1 Tax=Rhizophora mucronata TaxID=61149 RepID=A0A2P2R4A6_RHIMU